MTHPYPRHAVSARAGYSCDECKLNIQRSWTPIIPSYEYMPGSFGSTPREKNASKILEALDNLYATR